MSAQKNKRTAAIAAAILLAATGFAASATYALGHYPKQVDASAATAAPQSQAGTYYTCDMHPHIHLDKPGHCPICGMKLVKKVTMGAASAANTPSNSVASTPPMPSGLQEVTLSPEQRVLANVATAAVAPRPLSPSMAAAGQIVYDETRLAEVTARVDGRIERLLINSTGAPIAKGQPMATIYSPELVSSLQDYLTALTTYREMRQGPFSDLANGSRAMLQASRQRLRLWGLSDAQIDRVARSGKPSLELPLLAPASGVVTKKMVVAGQYVKTGDVLYDVADLSTVWVEANVFEAQLSAVKVGQRVAVTTAAYPGKTFPGRVAFIYPFLSPETRSVKVRAELPNPAGLLKPDMFVSVQIHQAPGRSNALAVPASAVIDAGRRKIVFVEVSPGVFRPREVSLGAPAGEYYPVLSGLAAGDKVATSGGFLLDANSQIQAGGGDTAGMDMPSQGGPQGATGTSGAMGEMPGMAMPRNGAGGK